MPRKQSMKLKKMRELKNYFLKKRSKKNLGKVKTVKKSKKKLSIKKILLKSTRKLRKYQKGGSVRFQPATDIMRSGLAGASDIKDTFLGN